MLRAIIIFAVLALLFGVLGFGGIAGAFSTVAYVLAIVFGALFVISAIMSATRSASSAL